MIKLPIYMDYHATTPVDEHVMSAMLPYFNDKFGNAASRQHQYGWIADEAVESSRSTIAKCIGAQPKEIVFTSGATESNNLALKGAADALKQKGNHLITVQTEHKSVLDTSKKLERHGFQVTYLPVNESGLVDVDELEAAFTPKTILVSVMAANNEIGTLQPVEAIGKLCRTKGVLFHCDATQAVGKIPIDVERMSIDLMSFSGHKMYGPKGIGALFVWHVGSRIRLAQQIDGGGHERGIRSGTLNVPGIVGLAQAVKLSVESMDEESRSLSRFRNKMLDAFVNNIGDVFLNGHPTVRLPNNLNVSFLHVDENALMMSMKDVAVSTGSACSSAAPEPSHVLKALRLSPDRLTSAIRFGLGRFTTEEEVNYVIDRVIKEVVKLRSVSTIHHTTNASLVSH